jgi:hypothetical protein
VAVASEAEIRDKAYNAAAGTTILISSGTYSMSNYVHILNDGVTLRGQTGNRADVILDFGGMTTGHEGIHVYGDDVTIADLTIRNSAICGVSIQGVDRPMLYNLHIVDINDQLVKVNPIGDGSDDGLLACSRLEYTTAAPDTYTNGISAHNAHNWVVRDNEWYRIRTPTNDPVPTILFWSASSGTVVERNLLVDCYQGISFGNASHGSGDHVGGVVRNNMIIARLPHDVAIEMVHADGWLVTHNTALLLDPGVGLTWGMEARFSDTDGVFSYNLTNMNIWADRDGAAGVPTGNLTNAEQSWFVDPSSEDLHLVASAAQAINQAISTPQVNDDYDGQTRPVGLDPDIGADEFMAELIFADGFESGSTSAWSAMVPRCDDLTELQCIDSGECTLILVSEMTGEYACRPAEGLCEPGFLQRSDTAQSCEAREGCSFVPGVCYCPPDLVCFCGGGLPPQCVES